MTGASLKRNLKRSRFGVIAGRIAVERSRDLRRLLGRRDGPMGATHRRFDLEGSLGYIDEVFNDYRTYGELGPGDLDDADVLELGPGDNLGVAMRLIAAGARRVVATDRFVPFRDPVQERRIYEALIERLPSAERARVAAVTAGPSFRFEDAGIQLLEETPIEDAPTILGSSSFDLIVSRAVLEHVHDLDQAFSAMDQLLRPGGTMIHKVDLRDHGLFTEGGQNALTFLSVSDRVYRWMGEETAGLPNRRLLGWYQAKLNGLGYESRYSISHLAGIEPEHLPHEPLEEGASDPLSLAEVEAIRARLLPRFRGLAPEELSIAGFMVVARKPGGGG